MFKNVAGVKNCHVETSVIIIVFLQRCYKDIKMILQANVVKFLFSYEL